MKNFIIDQILFLVIGIAIMILIPIFCGLIFTLIFEIAVLLCWGYLCRRILLIPFDLILGQVTQTGYFATQCGIENLEFYKDMYYYEWKFNTANGQMLRLLVPTVVTQKEAYKIVLPPKDKKLNITYFKCSKILLQWHQG